MIAYLFKVQCCWLLLFAFYYFFIKKETLFNVNRMYLLASLVFGLVVPLLPAFSFFKADGNQAVETLLYVANPTVEIEFLDYSHSENQLSGWMILSLIYVAGIFFFLGRFFIGINNIFRTLHSGIKSKLGPYFIVSKFEGHQSFSFFNYLFIGNEVPDEEIDNVIRHEISHAKDHHSMDVIFTELLKIVFWFSPLIYWYCKAIKLNHEYIADQYVTQKEQVGSYSRLLLAHANYSNEPLLASFIFRSPLKNRIQMLYKRRTGNLGKLKYLSILPLALVVALLFSNNTLAAELDNLSQTNDHIQIDTDTIPPPAPTPPPPPPPPPPNRPVTQSDIPAPVPPPTAPDPVRYEGEVFVVVEEMPRFPGCEEFKNAKKRKNCADEAMLKYIYKNLNYPLNARKNGVEGVVVVQFIVRNNGTLSDIVVARDI